MQDLLEQMPKWALVCVCVCLLTAGAAGLRHIERGKDKLEAIAQAEATELKVQVAQNQSDVQDLKQIQTRLDTIIINQEYRAEQVERRLEWIEQDQMRRNAPPRPVTPWSGPPPVMPPPSP